MMRMIEQEATEGTEKEKWGGILHGRCSFDLVGQTVADGIVRSAGV